jgi:hypothetical protein
MAELPPTASINAATITLVAVAVIAPFSSPIRNA